MDPKLLRKLVVSIGGVVIAIALVVGLYFRYGRPYYTKWREARTEITTREKRLDQLRKAFANQENPQAELKTLQQEIEYLKEANTALEKLKKAGKENTEFPKELDDPVQEIRVELYKEYMKPVMEMAEDTVKENLRKAQISPPEIRLYEELRNADEAAYYTNRAVGLTGLIDIMSKARKPDAVFVFDKLELQDYNTGKANREGAVNVLKYTVELTLDTKSLVAFLYQLQESNDFYYVEEMKIEPRSTRRSANQQLKINATINTTMIFESQVQAQVKAAAAKASTATAKKGGGGGWMTALAAGMMKTVEAEKAKPKKKWYEFWK